MRLIPALSTWRIGKEPFTSYLLSGSPRKIEMPCDSQNSTPASCSTNSGLPLTFMEVADGNSIFCPFKASIHSWLERQPQGIQFCSQYVPSSVCETNRGGNSTPTCFRMGIRMKHNEPNRERS